MIVAVNKYCPMIYGFQTDNGIYVSLRDFCVYLYG
jgi:hypothetical protein